MRNDWYDALFENRKDRRIAIMVSRLERSNHGNGEGVLRSRSVAVLPDKKSINLLNNCN